MTPADPSQTSGARAVRARRRRRLPAAQRFDSSVASPCIAVCQIDEATGFCLGCFRSLDEIRDWPIMTAAQKTEALARTAGRRAAAGR